MRRRAQLGIFVAAAVCGAISLTLAASSQQIKKASRFTQKGNRALEAGRIADARTAFDKSLEQVQGFPEGHMGLGMIAMRERSYETALSHFEQARDGYAQLGEALYELRTQRYVDAQTHITELNDSIRQLQAAPPSASADSPAASRRAAQISQLENAIQQLDAIQPPDRAQMNEPPGEIYFYIGNALFQLGRIDDAVEAWSTCCRRSPKFAMVYNNLALAHWKSGRLDEARSSLAKAEELGFPVNPQFKADLERASR